MSTEEKIMLEEQKKRRKNLIILQICIIAILTIVTGILSLTYKNINEMYYITYSESSSVDYKVSLKENNLYEDDYLGEDFVYVTSLMNNIEATFNYKLNIDADSVKYKLKYKANAFLQIVETSTNVAVYKHEYKLFDEIKKEYDTKNVDISIPLTINFDQYNNEAVSFVKALDLKNTKATLLVTLTFDVESECADYENNNNSNTISLIIPLNTQVCEITESQSVPTSNIKTIACEKTTEKKTIITFVTISGVLDLIAVIVLVAFIYLTRNTHINYSIKIKKILNAYKSYIQRINNEFDKTGYQILYLNTFQEMLEIRDTVQSPILMNENEDKTKAEFVIPTLSKLLYVFEIKIDNYDEIYGLEEDSNEIVTNIIEENDENIEETLSEQALVESDIEIEDDNISVDEVIEEKNADEALVESDIETEDDNISLEEVTEEEVIVKKDRKQSEPFINRIINANEKTQNFYNVIKNELLSFNRIKTRISKKCESFRYGKKLYAKIKLTGSTLKLYLSLNPEEFNVNIYHHKDMSHKKPYVYVPLQMRLSSQRSVKKTLVLISILMKKNGINKTNQHVEKDYIKEIEKLLQDSQQML